MDRPRLIATSLVVGATGGAIFIVWYKRMREYVRPSVVVIGDSITEAGSCCPVQPLAMRSLYDQAGASMFIDTDCPPAEDGPGWAVYLAHNFLLGRRCADVYNRGFAGYTSRMILNDLQAGLLGLPRDGGAVLAVALMLGSNDHANEESTQHVPVNEFESNLVAILEGMRQRFPTARLLLLTPPPCDGAKLASHMVRTSKGSREVSTYDRGEQRLAPYVAATRRAALAAHAQLVDVHTTFLERCAARGVAFGDCLYDGLHPNGAGHVHLYHAVSEGLIKAGLEPLSLPRHRPDALHRLLPSLFDEEGRWLPQPQAT